MKLSAFCGENYCYLMYNLVQKCLTCKLGDITKSSIDFTFSVLNRSYLQGAGVCTLNISIFALSRWENLKILRFYVKSISNFAHVKGQNLPILTFAYKSEF